mmetsp:Transcript_3060/g.4918  ORF Transcript_3060/g.4918 Transcript_3060/m.4918 type:complete len:391 (-) Transcript_3060:228-1400(-)
MLADSCPLLFMEPVVAGADPVPQLALVLAVEGHVAAQQDEADHARAPHVHLRAVRPARPHLGRHVLRRAADLVVVPQGGDVAGEPEVADLEVCIVVRGGQQQVLALEVPVHHVAGVQVGQRADQRGGQLPRRALVVVVPRHQPVEQLPAGHQLEDQVGDVVLSEGVVQADHVRVVQLPQHRHLGLQALEVGHAHARAVHALHRELRPRPRRRRRRRRPRPRRAQEHLPVGAGAQLAPRLVEVREVQVVLVGRVVRVVQLAPGVEAPQLAQVRRQVPRRQNLPRGLHPGVVEQRGGRRAAAGVHAQHAAHQVPGQGADPVPVLRVEPELAGLHAVLELRGRARVEGRVAPQQQEQGRAQRPHVHGLGVRPAGEHLGGHEHHRAHLFAFALG